MRYTEACVEENPPPDVDAAAHEPAVRGAESSTITAPMPGTVIKVLVAPGDHVQARQPLVAPYDSTVRAVHVTEGDRVAGGTVLVELGESS